MGNCLGCKKKLSFWEGYSNSNGEYCKKCFPHKKKILEELTGKNKIELDKSKQKKENLQKEKTKQEKMIQEYERKCNKCGKIWHSLKKEEDELQSGTKLNALAGFATAISGNLAASAQASKNSQSSKARLEDLKKCPECGSRNYSEEISEFEKK